MATEQSGGKPVNRWRNLKLAGKAGMGVGNAGVSMAQHHSHASIALFAAGAAASATGIGLVVTGAALTLAQTALSVRSAYKSKGHRDVLQNIYDRKNGFACNTIPSIEPYEVNPAEHAAIADILLPYLIEQKNKKYHRKVVGAVPVVSLAESVRAVGKKAYKAASGTLGVERKRFAGLLARHLTTHDCALCQAIVADLYSADEMLWMLEQDHDKLVPLLESKMKST